MASTAVATNDGRRSSDRLAERVKAVNDPDAIGYQTILFKRSRMLVSLAQKFD
jgi:hypothetical protein